MLLNIEIELVVSFQQGKVGLRKKGYSVIIHLKSVVNVCCRL